MRNRQWEAIHTVFEAMRDLSEGGDDSSSVSGPYSAARPIGASEPGPAKTPGAAMDREALIRHRSEIRRRLDVLRIKLKEEFSEFDTFLILFPIVAHFDELVQTRYLEVSETSWPPLQQELFKVDKAGELFYETLDDILRKPQTPTLVFEVYYFCLCHGFRGKYEGNPVKINEYMSILQHKIPVQVVAVDHSEHEKEPVRIGHIGSAVWYYAAVALFLGAVYGAFCILAN